VNVNAELTKKLLALTGRNKELQERIEEFESGSKAEE